MAKNTRASRPETETSPLRSVAVVVNAFEMFPRVQQLLFSRVGHVVEFHTWLSMKNENYTIILEFMVVLSGSYLTKYEIGAPTRIG